MTGRKRALLRAGTAAAAAGTVVALLPLAAGATRLVTPDATQQAKLTGSDAVAGSSVGSSVAISNSTAAVSGGGAIYVFVRSSSGAWAEQATLARPGRTLGAVAISGDTIVAGAAGSDVPAGAADVFVRDGGTWTFQAELTSADGASRDGFGFAVAAYGQRVVVGAPFHSQEQGLHGTAYVFLRSGGTWTQQAELAPRDLIDNDQFGTSVGIYRSTALVGAPGIFQSGTPGRAYVFARSGSTWAQQAELRASDGRPFDEFGGSVSVAGSTAVVGAYYANGQAGAAYVFGRAGAAWSQQAKLVPTDAASGDQFGFSVAISGDQIVAGAHLKKSPQGRSRAGAAYAFARSGSTWSQQAKLLASDGGVGDSLGRAAALSGRRALLGAPGNGGNTGAAYLFVLPPPAAG